MLIFDISLSACYLSACLHACLPVCQLPVRLLYLHVPTFLFTHCPIALQACQSVNLPVRPFPCPPNCMSARVPICQPACIPTCLPATFLFVNLSVLTAFMPTWLPPTYLSVYQPSCPPGVCQPDFLSAFRPTCCLYACPKSLPAHLLSANLPVCLTVFLSTCFLPTCQSVYQPSAHLMSANLPFFLTVFLPTCYLPTCLSVYQPSCPLCQPVCLS